MTGRPTLVQQRYQSCGIIKRFCRAYEASPGATLASLACHANCRCP
jgi:hypothetical protein